MAPSRSGVDSYSFGTACDFRSLELPRLFGLSKEFVELSDRWDLCEVLGALRPAKNERDGSRLCFGESFGEGGYCGMAVKPGVGGSAARLGETGMVSLSDLLLDSCVTGRMVAPLKKGELDGDLGERGVRGLAPSELWAPGVSGDEIFAFVCRVEVLRSKFGTVDCRDGIFEAKREPVVALNRDADNLRGSEKE